MKRSRRLSAEGRRNGGRRGEAGTTFAEVLTAAATALIVAAISVPALTAQRGALHAAGAARHVAALVHAARAEALKRGVHVALVFQPSSTDFRFAMFADGNYDGVRSADMAAGADRQVSAWVRIGDQFSGTAFGIVPGVTDPDSGALLSGSPLKLGGSSMLSFGPAGGATSGTVYVRGPASQQYALRILGATGRSRLLRYEFGAGRWVEA
ncbi:MAG: GspH/FimT family pseudopilin [Vicinamibacterales bacterium]